MALGKPEEIQPATLLHRVGGGGTVNLRLSELDRREDPPGISILLGGTPLEAAEQMRRAFPGSRKWQRTANVVGTATADAIRQAGFEILPDPTGRFPNHARLIHAEGVAGFTDDQLELLSKVFKDTTGC